MVTPLWKLARAASQAGRARHVGGRTSQNGAMVFPSSCHVKAGQDGTSVQIADKLKAFDSLDTLGSSRHLESRVWSAKVGHRELWQGAD